MRFKIFFYLLDFSDIFTVFIFLLLDTCHNIYEFLFFLIILNNKILLYNIIMIKNIFYFSMSKSTWNTR